MSETTPENPAENPLEAALSGLGGLDFNTLLQQAQAMQEQMAAASQELAEAEVEGTVADGLVTVTVNGTGELKRVKIRAGSFDPDDTEDLEDMVVAAYRDAKTRADAEATAKLGPLAGGVPDLGGGGGLPLGF